MEPQGLGHHDDMLHHDHHQSLHEQHFRKTAPNGLQVPKISLRSISKSDPHLNIPHLLVSQDEEHPSLNRFVSGLFHVNNALPLRTPVSSTAHLQHLHDENMSANRGQLFASESSASLLTEPPAPSLRKSSSAIDWNGAIVESTRKNSKQLEWHAPVVDQPVPHNIALSTLAHTGAFGVASAPLLHDPHHHHHEGGLVMSSSSAQNPNMSMVAAPLSQGPFSSGMSSGLVSSAQATSAPPNPLQPQSEGHDRKGHGVFGNMFRQGFFSRPVVRTEEENYRYLMALDR